MDILKKLVAFPTVSSESNLAMIDFICELLKPAGARVTLTHDDARRKANVHAVIGPSMSGGIMLSGHTDVVPTVGQAWTSDPFQLIERDGRLMGRGTCDMKGFIASALAAAEAAGARQLSRPLHLAFSYDEEIGCVGVQRLIEQLALSPHERPAFCIVGEPTGLETVIAHKGKLAARVHCRGRECHSAHAPDGLNAIYLATDMVTALRREQQNLMEAGSHHDAFTVPFSTVHVGLLHGGTALNIVPRDCSLDFEIRHLPSTDPKQILERLFDEAAAITRRAEQRFPGTGVSIEILNSYPALQTESDSEVVRQTGQLTGRTGPLRKIAFGTEGGLFNQQLGMPTVVCGPGDIRQAHQPDEYVTRDQLAECDRFLNRVVDSLAA